MSRSRTTGQDIAFNFWLAFRRDGEVKLTKGMPALSPDQRAMQIEARLPKSLWETPALSATISVADTGQAAAIAARVEQFSEQLKAAVGCDVVLTVTTPEDQS